MKLQASNNKLTLTERDRLVSGTKEIFTASFTFDGAWDGFVRTAVFECGSVRREMVLDNSGVCVVPWEVLLPEQYLRVGVYGVAGDQVKPTTYCEPLFINRGAEPAEPGAAPTPTEYEQILSAIQAGMLKGEKGDPGPKGDTGPAGSITVDNELSDTSANPVQNKVIQSALSALRDMVYPMDTHYPGIDLTEKFADEIAAAPYSGDAWAWIKARIQAGNYTGIHVKDFIPFTTANGVTLHAEVAGIDTYRNYGDSAVGRHIDFICRELWPTRKPINPVNYNNGLIPVENITFDGAATSYTLTKEMNDIASITKGGDILTGWHYDSASFTITFDEAPKAGTAVVTGTGTEHPWLACDLYHWLNSLSGQIPNSTGLNPAVKHVDYTHDGVYYYLPQELKNVIIEKRFYLMKRYSETGILSDDNAGGWVNLGKLWLPTEPEVYGMPVWGGKGGHSLGGSAGQYPIFAGNMNRVKYRPGSRSTWFLLAPYTNSTYWCSVNTDGRAAYYYASNSGINTPVCFRIG